MAAPLQSSGHPSQGDRPEERRAPTQGLAGDIFITVGTHEFFLDFGDCVSEVVRSFWLGLGIPVLGAARLPVT